MFSRFAATYLALWGLVVLQGLILLAVLRQLTELGRKLQGFVPSDTRLPIGSHAPEFKGRDLRSGGSISSRSLSKGEAILLFVTPECSVCKHAANTLRAPATETIPPVVVLCKGDEPTCRDFLPQLSVDIPFLCDPDGWIAAQYKVVGFPTAILIDGNSQIRGYGYPKEIDDLGRLVANAYRVAEGLRQEAQHEVYVAAE